MRESVTSFVENNSVLNPFLCFRHSNGYFDLLIAKIVDGGGKSASGMDAEAVPRLPFR
jgi:hypothetical protein